MDLHDSAPDEALGMALDSLDPAVRLAVAAIEAAVLSGEWQEALMAIEGLASSSAEALNVPLLAALLAGAARVGDRLPVGVSVPSQQSAETPPLPPAVATGSLKELPGSLKDRGGSLNQPQVLPLVQRAVESLRSRNLVTPERFSQLSEEARSRALVVAGIVREQALAKLQLLLEEQAATPSLASFKRRLQETGLIDSITGQHVETAFRDAVQTAYSDGMDRLLEDPLVGDALPFAETLPIRDSRLSKVCEWASRCGINGTAIYLRADPSWQLVRSPRHIGCRCGTNFLTREMAASRGITGARHVTLPDLLVKLLRR